MLFSDLEGTLFETTTKPVEVIATTEMDFMYHMIIEAETTKKPEQKMTISIIDKVVELLTTTLSPTNVEETFLHRLKTVECSVTTHP